MKSTLHAQQKPIYWIDVRFRCHSFCGHIGFCQVVPSKIAGVACIVHKLPINIAVASSISNCIFTEFYAKKLSQRFSGFNQNKVQLSSANYPIFPPSMSVVCIFLTKHLINTNCSLHLIWTRSWAEECAQWMYEWSALLNNFEINVNKTKYLIYVSVCGRSVKISFWFVSTGSTSQSRILKVIVHSFSTFDIY